MSQLSDQTERQVYSAIMAARAGSPDGLSSQLERQIYAALVAAGSGGGSASNDFSLAEQAWGTWVDGKTIYRKIFTDIAYKSNGKLTNGNIDLSDLNIDKVIGIDCVRTSGNGANSFPMSANVYLYVGNNSLIGAAQVGISSIGAGTYLFIAIYYTKAD